MVTLEPDTPSLTHHRHGKVLIAFDFDHTIVEENTDVFIRRLLGPDGLPQDIQAQQKSLGWTKFMGAIFQHLHDRGITSNQIRDLLQRTPLTPGEILRSSFCQNLVCCRSIMNQTVDVTTPITAIGVTTIVVRY